MDVKELFVKGLIAIAMKKHFESVRIFLLWKQVSFWLEGQK